MTSIVLGILMSAITIAAFVAGTEYQARRARKAALVVYFRGVKRGLRSGLVNDKRTIAFQSLRVSELLAEAERDAEESP